MTGPGPFTRRATWGAALLGLAAAACGAPGGDETLVLGFDTRALQELEVESVLVEAFEEEDVNGDPVTCARLMENPADPADFLSVAPSLLVDVDEGETSLTLVMPSLPPGTTWFLVAGFSAPGGSGRVNAAGCGRAEIERGHKATVVVRMEEVE